MRKLFNSRAAEVNSALPQGYDDKGSLFFVVPELREHYTACAVQPISVLTEQNSQKARDLLARVAASEAVPEYRPGVDPGLHSMVRVSDQLKRARANWYDTYDSALVTLLEDPPENLLALVNHHARFYAAVNRKKTEDRRAVIEAERKARDTCPVCGVDDRQRIGTIESRAVVAGLPTDFRSCGLCFAVKQADVLEAARQETLPDGVSRLARITASTHGPSAQEPARGWGRAPQELVL